MITKKELAQQLKISVPTVDRNMAKGMPYIKLPTGAVRFELENVMKWLKG